MKSLPIAVTAEKAALSLIALDPDVLPHLSWSSDLFAFEQHKLIFKALERVYQRTGSTNTLSAISDLETTGKLNAAGGKEGVMEDLKTIFMAAGSMCVETAEDYRQQLLIAKSYRDAIGLWEENEADIIGMRADLSSIAESIANAIPQATQAKDVKAHLMDFLDDLDDKKPIEKFPLGIPKVDKLLGGGMQRGEMMVVGAATSGGKSILLYQAALTALMQGKNVAIFSLEMPSKAILQRMASNLIGKQIIPMREANVVNDWRNVANAKEISSAIEQLMKMKLTLRDDLSDVGEIIAEAQRLASLGKADVIVVDYLQIVEMPKADNREQAVSELSRRLKLTALKTNSVVLTASQLNDDFVVRESRAIGMNTDFLLIILHPDDKKKVTDFRRAPAKIETSRIRFDKNRRGQRDVFVPVKMLGAISRFEQIDEH